MANSYSGQVPMRIWRDNQKPDRIIYVITNASGKPRKLVVDKGHALYPELESYLDAPDTPATPNGSD